MTSVSKNVYIDTLDDALNKYISKCNSTIDLKPADVKSSLYVDSSKENKEKNPKFKISDIFLILK